MKIFITGNNTLTGANLKIGCFYNAEPADTGTDQQRKTIFALMDCYYFSNCHSYNCRNKDEFYEVMKRDLGAGNEMHKSLVDPVTGSKLEEPVIVHGLKSIKKYTKKERMDFISNLLAEMEMVGVDTPKFREILQGLMLEQNSMRAAV
jgi:hypothetical protein